MVSLSFHIGTAHAKPQPNTTKRQDGRLQGEGFPRLPTRPLQGGEQGPRGLDLEREPERC